MLELLSKQVNVEYHNDARTIDIHVEEKSMEMSALPLDVVCSEEALRVTT